MSLLKLIIDNIHDERLKPKILIKINSERFIKAELVTIQNIYLSTICFKEGSCINVLINDGLNMLNNFLNIHHHAYSYPKHFSGQFFIPIILKF